MYIKEKQTLLLLHTQHEIAEIEASLDFKRRKMAALQLHEELQEMSIADRRVSACSGPKAAEVALPRSVVRGTSTRQGFGNRWSEKWENEITG